jgi:hypothetical protein
VLVLLVLLVLMLLVLLVLVLLVLLVLVLHCCLHCPAQGTVLDQKGSILLL